MASESTINAIKSHMRELRIKRESTKKWMKSMRQESLKSYRCYRLGKQEYIKLGASILELKDDLRRIDDDK